MTRLLLTILLLSLKISAFAQNDSITKKSNKKQTQWYLAWGYTKAVYSKSTIHFKNLSNRYNPATGRIDYYDFYIHNVTAHDRPDFDKIKDVVNITIPQFVIHGGYSFNKNSGIEINYDHTKYVVDDYQQARLSGHFNNVPVDSITILDPEKFLHFEHTDGANFFMVNYVRRWKLVEPNKNFKLSWTLKPGGGVVIPRTFVSLFGQTLNNNWKVAGWIVGVESGLRIEFLKNGFFEFVGKCAYADYVNAFVLGKGHGKASHRFFAGQLTATLGCLINRNKE